MYFTQLLLNAGWLLETLHRQQERQPLHAAAVE
jgi:hypothetical protein